MTAIQKGLVTTFSVCFCSGGLSFGRKSLQGALPCERGEGGKDPGEQRTPRSSCAGQGARGRRGELEVSFASGTAAAELPPLPPAPPAHVWSFRCQRTGDVAGPVLRQGARPAAPSSPGGCLAPPAPLCDAGRARPGAGAAGSDWGLPALPAPLRLGSAQPWGCPAGPSCCPPPPPLCQERGPAADPGLIAPRWLPTASGGFPRVEESKCFRNTSTFF